MASKFLFKLFVTISVAPIITGILLLLILRQLKIKKHNINRKFQENRPHYSIVPTNTQKEHGGLLNINIQRRARKGNYPTGK